MESTKHAHWVNLGRGLKYDDETHTWSIAGRMFDCSACGCSLCTDEGLPKVCPACGAIMDEEGE